MAKTSISPQFTDPNGRLLPESQDLIERIDGVVSGIEQFVGADGRLSADAIAEGLTQTVESIAGRIFTYDADGFVTKIEVVQGGKVAETQELTYDGDKKVTERKVTNEARVTTESVTYDVNDQIGEISVSTVGF